MFIPAAPTLDLATLLGLPQGDGPSERSLHDICRETSVRRWPTPGHVIHTASGRAALCQALQAWNLHQGTALLPAYLCASVITPFQHAGLIPRFYRLDRQLRIDVADLETRLTDDVQVVVVIHYLGFPQPDLPTIAELCRAHGAYLIEDCAHALFSRPADPPLGMTGDAAVYSLPKSLPVPDGGLLVLHSSLSNRGSSSFVLRPKPVLSSVEGAFVRAAKLLLYALEFRLGVSPRPALLRIPGLRRRIQAAGDAALTDLDATWSPLTRYIVERTPGAPIVQARRANFRYLRERFPASETVRPLFDRLPEGVCPLGFPLLVAERDAWRDRLYRAGVMTRTYWDILPPEVLLDQFPDAAYLRDHILTLPVHQSLGAEHMEWMLAVIRGKQT